MAVLTVAVMHLGGLVLPPVLSRRRTAVPPVAAAAVLLVALTSCSSDDGLDVDGFSPGTCTTVAGTLQDIDRTLHQVDQDELSAEQAAERLKAAQQVLAPAGRTAQTPVSASVVELVTRMGFFRVSVDTNTYASRQRDDVASALDTLAQDCRKS